MRIVAVPVPTGSPAGDSASPVIATVNARPPAAAVRMLRGQRPLGAGMMSAACLVCVLSVRAETETLT